jgi:uncharacterized protein YjiS (DUF1127 family)
MLKAIIVAYKRHSIYTRTLKELERLSDKELYDLGLDRSKITSLAYEVTYGKELKSDFKPFWNFFKVKTEKNKIEEYLADSENLVDLENRIKAMDRGLAPWQVQSRSFAHSWIK